MSLYVCFCSLSFITSCYSFPDVPSPAWATSPASLAGADADDAGDAGDVAQEVLRMQKRTWGESNTRMFLRNCVPPPPPPPSGGVTGKEVRGVSYVQHAALLSADFTIYKVLRLRPLRPNSFQHFNPSRMRSREEFS